MAGSERSSARFARSGPYLPVLVLGLPKLLEDLDQYINSCPNSFSAHSSSTGNNRQRRAGLSFVACVMFLLGFNALSCQVVLSRFATLQTLHSKQNLFGNVWKSSKTFAACQSKICLSSNIF